MATNKNCWKCGINLDEDEFTYRTIQGVRRIICDEEVLNCEPDRNGEDFYPEDTPCLDEPWWRNP